jgi:prevent-host-death family protein
MLTVPKGVLKSKMLEYFRNIQSSGEELLVTDHGKPVLRVVPIKETKPIKELFLKYQGKAHYHQSETSSETEEWGDLA